VNDDCLKLTTYFGERDRAGDRFLADALLEVYGAHELEVSLLMRGSQGFGLKQHVRTDRLLSLSEDLALVSVAVDTRARIEKALPDVMALKRSGLVTLERARLLTGDLGPVELPEELHEATKLTVYVGRRERVYDTPAFQAVCDLLYRRGIAGATVLLGVDGTRNGVRYRARFFGRNAEVPIMIIAVGDGHAIAGVLPELGGLLRHPLVTLERVRVCKRDGLRLARPHTLPGTDEHGLALWQKLMIYTSEQARHGGRPVHQELVRRLRSADAAGATTLRGVWGFHGDHAPHGDTLLQLRRHVPTVTIVVDRPDRVTAAFDVADELTAEHGLVTSEMVPAYAALAEDARRGGLQLARHEF
jgi:PII-like signaling protein